MHKETGFSTPCCVKKHKSDAFTKTEHSLAIAERQQIKNSFFLKWAKNFLTVY